MTSRIDHPPVTKNLKIIVETEYVGRRLDMILARSGLDPDLSRVRIQNLIHDGFIRVNGNTCKAGYHLKIADVISITLPAPTPSELTPEQVDFQVLFEDNHILVLSKPPGVVVHPAPGHAGATLVHGLLFSCQDLSGINGEIRPGIVHRLDKDTSGVMVVAKNDAAHHALVLQFKERHIEKKYRALVMGRMAHDSGRISLPIGRHQGNRKKMAVCPRNGREATTTWNVLQFFPAGFSYLELGLETGRTHQIRVHMAHLGHPIIGDLLYGGKNRAAETLGLTRQCLHAYKLTLTHPASGERLQFTAPIPADFLNALRILELL